MAIEVLLNFDSQGAYDELGKALENEIKALCEVVINTASANLGGQYPLVDADMQELGARLLSLAQSGLIEGQIGSNIWEAWMAEWGSGSLMDRDNPDLSAYMASEYWNPVREGFDITGRPQGPYLGLDGEMHESSGKLAGVSLEWLVENDPDFRAWAEATIGENAFKPRVPLHFMRDALESNRARIIDQLNGVLEVFNFGTFFV